MLREQTVVRDPKSSASTYGTVHSSVYRSSSSGIAARARRNSISSNLDPKKDRDVPQKPCQHPPPCTFSAPRPHAAWGGTQGRILLVIWYPDSFVLLVSLQGDQISHDQLHGRRQTKIPMSTACVIHWRFAYFASNLLTLPAAFSKQRGGYNQMARLRLRGGWWLRERGQPAEGGACRHLTVGERQYLLGALAAVRRSRPAPAFPPAECGAPAFAVPHQIPTAARGRPSAGAPPKLRPRNEEILGTPDAVLPRFPALNPLCAHLNVHEH